LVRSPLETPSSSIHSVSGEPEISKWIPIPGIQLPHFKGALVYYPLSILVVSASFLFVDYTNKNHFISKRYFSSNATKLKKGIKG
jgi:hypothetical protein